MYANIYNPQNTTKCNTTEEIKRETAYIVNRRSENKGLDDAGLDNDGLIFTQEWRLQD